jgi:hypothetical protein
MNKLFDWLNKEPSPDDWFFVNIRRTWRGLQKIDSSRWCAIVGYAMLAVPIAALSVSFIIKAPRLAAGIFGLIAWCVTAMFLLSKGER